MWCSILNKMDHSISQKPIACSNCLKNSYSLFDMNGDNHDLMIKCLSCGKERVVGNITWTELN